MNTPVTVQCWTDRIEALGPTGDSIALSGAAPIIGSIIEGIAHAAPPGAACAAADGPRLLATMTLEPGSGRWIWGDGSAIDLTMDADPALAALVGVLFRTTSSERQGMQ